MSTQNALDEFIKRNGMAPLDEEGRNDYRTGLGYFVDGWDANENQSTAELAFIDEILSRRPALDGCNTRAEKLEKCIATAKKVDELAASLAAIQKQVNQAYAAGYKSAIEWSAHWIEGSIGGLPNDVILFARNMAMSIRASIFTEK